jgi:preprotein translocase subunit YajC
MPDLIAPLALFAVEDGGAASAIGGLLPLILIVVVFYFLLIRPQQKRARQHAELVSSVEPGDRIVTVGGMHGTVVAADEDTMRIEVAPNMVITMARSAIARKLVDADMGLGVDVDSDGDSGAER